MKNIRFAIDYLTKNIHKMVEDNNNYATQSVKLAIEALEKQTEHKLLKMDIEELVEKYRGQRDDYIKQSKLGDFNRLMAESKINVLTEVIGDLMELR